MFLFAERMAEPGANIIIIIIITTITRITVITIITSMTSITNNAKHNSCNDNV